MTPTAVRQAALAAVGDYFQRQGTKVRRNPTKDATWDIEVTKGRLRQKYKISGSQLPGWLLAAGSLRGLPTQGAIEEYHRKWMLNGVRFILVHFKKANSKSQPSMYDLSVDQIRDCMLNAEKKPVRAVKLGSICRLRGAALLN